MTEVRDKAETVSLLQDLGLKEYEARCFLTLTQLATATAKEISDHSEVPRTRVYDAIRTLEAQGLVEVQHSNPQQFRAVDVDEAATTLRSKYDDRIDRLEDSLEHLELEDDSSDLDEVQEVWSLHGHEAIESRTLDLTADADSEIVLLVVDESILTEALFDRLREAADRGVTVVAGGMTDVVVDRLERELPSVEVFSTGLDWLVAPDPDSEVAISRLLLVDRTTLLVSSYYPAADGPEEERVEQAVFANGLGNGVVVLIRRLVSSGLQVSHDPGK